MAASSQLLRVAEAVATLVRPAVEQAGGRVEVSFDPEEPHAGLTELKVTVLPAMTVRTRATRRTYWLDHTVELGIQRRLGTTAEGDVVTEDDLLEFAEDLAAHLEDNDPPDALGVRLLRLEVATTYAREHLDELNTFTGVLAAVYRGMRNGS